MRWAVGSCVYCRFSAISYLASSTTATRRSPFPKGEGIYAAFGGYTSSDPPSAGHLPLKGKPWALPRQCVKLQFAPQYRSRGPMAVPLFDAVRDEFRCTKSLGSTGCALDRPAGLVSAGSAR